MLSVCIWTLALSFTVTLLLLTAFYGMYCPDSVFSSVEEKEGYSFGVHG